MNGHTCWGPSAAWMEEQVKPRNVCFQCFETRPRATVQLTLRALALRVIAHPSSRNVISIITAVNCRSWNVSRNRRSPKIHKNLYFGVQGHPRSLNSVAIKSQCMTKPYLAPFLRYTNLLTENGKCSHPHSHLAPLLGGEPFRIYEKALRILKLESSRQPTVKIWWSTDPSLHRFWLIHPCDRQTDRQIYCNG